MNHGQKKTGAWRRLLRNRLAAALLPCLLLTAASGEGPVPAPGAAADAGGAIEKLFRAARYDSLLGVIAGYQQIATETGDSVLMGRMLVQRGRVALMTGNFAEAARLIDSGIDVARASRDTTGWMPALTFKGYALAGQGGFDEAMACYRQRLFLARRVRSPLDEAWALTNIAYVLHLRGDHDGATRDYLTAIDLFRDGGRIDLELTPLIGLGRVWGARGETAEAVRCYQRAWVVARETGDLENELWAANNLGALESVRGDMTRAIAFARRAYEIAREMGYPRGAVLPAINIASWRMDLGEYARAGSILEDVQEFCARAGGEEYRPKIEFHRARLAMKRGEYHAAAAEFRRLLDGGALEPQNEDYARVELASALAHTGRPDAAVELLSRRFATGVQWYGDSGTSARLLLSRLLLRQNEPGAALEQATRCREEAEEEGWRQTAVSARLRESTCYFALGKGADALASLSVALDSLDSVRGGFRDPEWREVYGQETAVDVLEACRVVLDYPGSLPRAQRERAFFETLQRFKARTLRERIGTSHAPPAETPVTAGTPVTLARLQSRVLSPGELFLDIVAGETQSVLFAVTTDSLRVLGLPGSVSDTREKAFMYRGVLSDPSPGSQALYSREQLTVMQTVLGKAVLGGVSDLLASHHRIIVSPDGFYATVPFGTLMPPAGPGPPGAGMLMDTHDVFEVPSASTLELLRTTTRDSNRGQARVLVMLPPDAGHLPGARAETAEIRRRYRGVEVAMGFEERTGGLAAIPSRFNVLHIAAHAVVSDESPWNSGFDVGLHRVPPATDRPAATTRGEAAGLTILSPEDSMVVASTFRRDDWLRAWQIARMSLPLDMAVLAGCETAGGRATTGEGVLGLTAAFASAGVPVVVSSLWPIDDRTTALVMGAFYSHLSAGVPVAGALRRAQLDVRDSNAGLHPFFWAGFTVAGDGTAVIDLARRRRADVVVPAGLALVAAVVVLFAWRRRSR